MRLKFQSLLVLLCMLFSSIAMQAQEKKTVTGVVQDAKGTALSGATVRESGTTNAVLSDAKGAFRIQVKSGATLEISYVGFDTYTVKVSGASTYPVTLQEKGSMQEVVVTSLGISREKKALGYATATIKAEDLTQAGSPNFATALYGKAPGVRIAATPGGATSAVNITVRGLNSITGNTQPLIVMDGVPIRNGEASNSDYWGDQRIRGNGLLDINPEDIDNISILKGASAAALYGSEAVNGVVLITTKSGTKGRKGLGVDVSANYSVDEAAYLPRYQNVRGYGVPKFLSNGGQDDNMWLWWDLDGDGTKETRSTMNASINYGPVFDGKPTLSWDGKIRPYEAQKDNYKNLFQTAHNSNITVAVSQSTENLNLRMSLTRQQNEGISLNSGNTKNIANLNAQIKLHKNFTTDVIVNYINQKTANRPYSIDRLTNNFTGMIGRFDNASWYLDRYQTSKGYRFVQGAGSQSLTPSENIIYPGFKADIADYVWRVNKINEDEFSNRVIASITNTWTITKGLKLRTRTSNDFTSMRTESRNYTQIPLSFGNSGGFGLSDYQASIAYADALLSYNYKLNKDIDLNALGGYTASKELSTTLSRSTNGGLSTENLFDIAASVNTPNSGSRRTSLVKDAFIGTVNASYKDFLYLEGTLRRDRTSTMNPNKNSFIYPSVNSSFVFSEAFAMPSLISYGKLRASWGIVGNYPGVYSANVAYNQSTLGTQGGTLPILYTAIPSSFGNESIKPEQKNEIEIGLDMKFLKNRIGLDVSYYNAQVVDQILPLTLPSTSGAGSILTNIGTLRNTGIEIGLSGTPYQTKDMKWEVILNLASNMNKVEKLAPGLTSLLHADYDGNAAQLVSLVGRPMGDLLAHPVAKDSKGQMIVDPNGLYKVDPNKMETYGNAMPKVVGGFINNLTYKNFSLDVVTDFRFGGHVMPTGLYWMISRGLLEESLNYMDKEHGGFSYYVTAAGKKVKFDGTQGPNGEKIYNDGMLLPGVKADGTPNDYVASATDYYWTVYNWGGPQYSPNTRYELYIQKNSYIKMRELALNYSLPANLAQKIGAKKLQVSVYGRNLFYLYRTLKDLDAEQTTAGSRWFQTVNNIGTNPSTKTVGVMLRASF